MKNKSKNIFSLKKTVYEHNDLTFNKEFKDQMF